MLFILYGPEEFLVSEELGRQKRRIADDQLGDLNVTTLDGARLTVDQLVTTCGAVPFFAEKRVVVITGLLSRFETRRRQSGEPATDGRKGKDKPNVEEFTRLLVALPQAIVVFLVDGEIETRTNPLFRLLEGHASPSVFRTPTGEALQKWIIDRMTVKNCKASREAVRRLAELVGPNLRALDGEIEKMATFAWERRVELQDVELLVVQVRQDTVFDLINAMLGRQSGVALSQLRELLATGAAAAQLLFMITRQFRQLLLTKDAQGLSGGELAGAQRALGMSEWAWNKSRDLARRYSWDELSETYRLLLDVDLAGKTGKVDPVVALELLTLDLCALGQTRKGRGESHSPARR